MPSRTSFFNSTLFRKNIHRAWPLWGMLSLLGSLIPLYLLLNLLRHPNAVSRRFFTESLYEVSAQAIPVFAFLYVVPVAMLMWGYLYNSRSVGFMHTLPVHRGGLFVTNLLSGFAILLIPYAVTGGLLCAEALCYGFFDGKAVLTAVVTVLLTHLTFFGIATLCAMATGNLFAMPLLYGLLNFVAPLVEFMVSTLSADFLLGISASVVHSPKLSPLWWMLETVDVHYNWVTDELKICTFEGMPLLLIYGAVGLVLLGVSWLLYRSRRSESAGDVIAFRWLTPIFRYGIAFLFAITLGRLFYYAVWESTLQSGSCADTVPMIICLAAAGVIGYYIASMLLEKTLRVFRNSVRGVISVTLGAVVLCLGCSADPFGVEDYVPSIADVESATVYGRYLYGQDATPEDAPLLTEEILALHQTIVDDKSYLRQCSDEAAQLASYSDAQPYDDHSTYVNFEYRLKNGKSIRRAYTLYLTEERMEQANTADNAYLNMVNSPALALARLRLPAERMGLNAYIDFWYNDYKNGDNNSVSDSASEKDSAIAEGLYAAVLSDLQNGRGTVLTWDRLTEEYATEIDCYLNISFEAPIREGEASYWENCYIDVQPTMTDTLTYLVEHGLMSEKNIALFVGK